MGIGERIKEARLRANISQAELARRVGRSQSAVAEWETGDSEPRRNIMTIIAEALHVNAMWLETGGVSEGEHVFDALAEEAPGPMPRLAIEQGAIVATVEEGGKAEQVIAPGEIIERRPKPAKWSNVKDLYGFYLATDTLAPRINPGELIWVHPHRKPQPGQEAVFIAKDRKTKTKALMVKVYSGQTTTKWLVKQYNPKREFELKKTEWDCQLVVQFDLNR